MITDDCLWFAFFGNFYDSLRYDISVKITYVTHTRFPVQKAHGKQIADVCAALATLGHTVTLLCPTVSNAIKIPWYRYYDLPQSFQVRTLEHSDATRQWWVLGLLHFRTNMRRYKRALRRYLQTHKVDLLYVRSPVLLPTLLKTKIPVIVELHTLPRFRKRRFAKLCNRCSRVVCLTSAMKKALILYGVPPKKILVEHDGVDLSRFKKLPKSADAKKRTKHAPDDRPVVGYFGSFYTQRKIEKGLSVLIDAFALLRQKRIRIYGILGGGTEKEVVDFLRRARQKKLGGDVRFLGNLSPGVVPMHLRACDVLVYPAPESKHPYFQRDTSPLKIFEYLAAGRPIVCADLPPLRDIVSKSTVYFATPGDPGSFAHWIAHALKHQKEAETKAKKGLILVRHHSWEKRMERILRGVPHP